MKTVTIDLTGVKYIMELHRIIKESFQRSVEGFPDFYGNNLDALWDCLTGFIETPVEIVLIGVETLSEELMKYEVNDMIEVFKDAEREGCWGIKFIMR
jgi:ribonuclease inhibitor